MCAKQLDGHASMQTWAVSHTFACCSCCADSWGTQAGSHPRWPHPCHRLSGSAWFGGPWLSYGTAPSRQCPHGAVCCRARQRLNAALPRQRSGAAPWWHDPAVLGTAASDIPGAHLTSSLDASSDVHCDALLLAVHSHEQRHGLQVIPPWTPVPTHTPPYAPTCCAHEHAVAGSCFCSRRTLPGWQKCSSWTT